MKPWKLIIVAALGYFVDVYDIILFGVVRKSSLADLGVTNINIGLNLMNLQMIGMVLGGIIWGVLGDRIGRTKVLFGSILIYSLANLLNAFVFDTTTYGILRFIAGIGLAGELGAGITLVSELMDKENRGWGTTVIAAFGVLGSVAASLIGDKFHWRTAYIIGGTIGLLLLFFRMKTFESGMFKKVPETNKGTFLQIMKNKAKRNTYLRCLTLGMPLWSVLGIFVMLAPELGKLMGIPNLTAGDAFIAYSIGLSIGEVLSCIISQKLKDRRNVIACYLSLNAAGIILFSMMHDISKFQFQLACFGLGLLGGYFVLFLSMATEQFGTNIRATVATTTPNFVRGAFVPISTAFQWLMPSIGFIPAGLSITMFSIMVGLWSLFYLKETFGRDLDYIEHIK